MKNFLLNISILTVSLGIPVRSHAQFVIGTVVKLVVKKVINGIDLAVQRVQNKTIVLQNAEKELENSMAALHLSEISDWVEKERKLYQDYYQELWQVKQVIADYDRFRSIVRMETQMVRQSQAAGRLFRQDSHFTSDELTHITEVYAGMIRQALLVTTGITRIVTGGIAQMGDGGRLTMIDEAEQQLKTIQTQMNAFGQKNLQLSLSRSKEAGDLGTLKRLYGLP